MAKIAPVPIFAMMLLFVVSTQFTFQNWLAYMKVIESMGEETKGAIPAIPVFHKRSAQLHLPFIRTPT